MPERVVITGGNDDPVSEANYACNNDAKMYQKMSVGMIDLLAVVMSLTEIQRERLGSVLSYVRGPISVQTARAKE